VEETAGHRAREVVGLYGDPDTTWGIGLDTQWSTPIDRDAVANRLAEVVEAFPHLGSVLPLEVVPAEEWFDRRRVALSEPYDDRQLVRVLVSDTADRLLVTAHHGALDGLGMVGVIARAVAVHVATGARGVGGLSSHSSFLGSSLKRLGEALVSPPPRFRGSASTGTGEHVAQVDLQRCNTSTAVVAQAVTQVHRSWPGTRAASRPLLVTGVSRREAGDTRPDRQTGYVRFRVDPRWDLATTKERFRAVPPEPDFPETSVGGIGPRVIRLMRSRLGSTAQVSNIGVLEAPSLVGAALFPAVSGPWAVSFGAVSTSSRTTLTLRTRAAEFTAQETDELLRRVAAAVRPAQ
jgi:hypothetical protein